MSSNLDILQQPSPNFGERRDGQRPELIVIHYTAMESAQAAMDWLCNPEAEVSAHYVIAPDGQITQLVDEEKRAWHAGVGSWQGQGDVNSRSIGIELSNKGDHPFAAAQMDAVEMLLAGIMQRWDIGPDGVIGHSDMSPGRKIDPGPKFDWERLERGGLAGKRGYDDGPQEVSSELFRSIAQEFGYTADVDDETLLKTVRLRFRPLAEGPLEPADFSPLGHCAMWT